MGDGEVHMLVSGGGTGEIQLAYVATLPAAPWNTKAWPRPCNIADPYQLANNTGRHGTCRIPRDSQALYVSVM